MTAGAGVAGLILAAGESARMRRDKALLPYRGRTFLETIIVKLNEAGVGRVVVVLGHHAEFIQEAVDLTAVEIVTNRNYQQGQTSSLQAGLAALETLPAQGGWVLEAPEAIILCLVDHPAFEPATVSALMAAFERTAAPVVVPVLGGRRGHPVLIARPLFGLLLALGPGEGANTVIRACQDRTELVAVSDPGILIDVDDPETHRSLTK
jgi:molybdenum cofactor cytidylyltransferase